jgi:hypothetical protein
MRRNSVTFTCTLTNDINFFLIRVVRSGVQTGFTPHVGHFLSIVPVLGNCEDGEFAGKNEVLGGNLPEHHFVDHKCYLTRPGCEPGTPR